MKSKDLSRYKVKSRIVTCDICGKQMHARGIGTHKRQVHTGMKDIITKVSDKNFGEVTKVTADIDIKSFENVHLKSNSCTELDLKILLGKICRLVLSEESYNLMSMLNTNRLADELILDFERRFECKLSDIKMAFPNLKPAATDSENFKYVSFADLSYSN